MGIYQYLILLVRNLYKNSKGSVRINNSISDAIDIKYVKDALFISNFNICGKIEMVVKK